MAQIIIAAANPTWPEDFAALKRTIMAVAPAGAVIHHIGSTAVPGLAAKDVIDIQLTVDHLTDFDGPAMEAHGFVERHHLVDHCPPGLALPEADLQKRFFRSMGRPANLHIRERGRFNQGFSLLCRDFLRAHPTAAAAYGLIKQRLALYFPEDEDAYYDIKDPVFDIIVEGANNWARLVRWSQPSCD